MMMWCREVSGSGGLDEPAPLEFDEGDNVGYTGEDLMFDWSPGM